MNEDLNEVLIVEEQRRLESTGIFTLCVPHRKLLSPVNSKNCLSSAVRATSSRLPARFMRSVALYSTVKTREITLKLRCDCVGTRCMKAIRDRLPDQLLRAVVRWVGATDNNIRY